MFLFTFSKLCDVLGKNYVNVYSKLIFENAKSISRVVWMECFYTNIYGELNEPGCLIQWQAHTFPIFRLTQKILDTNLKTRQNIVFTWHFHVIRYLWKINVFPIDSKFSKFDFGLKFSAKISDNRGNFRGIKFLN